MKAIAALALLAAVVIACGDTPLALDDVRGQELTSLDELSKLLGCRTQISVFPHFTEVVQIDSETRAVDIASALLDRSMPTVDQAVQAGEIWLLVDSDSRVFAGMDVAGSISGCSF